MVHGSRQAALGILYVRTIFFPAEITIGRADIRHTIHHVVTNSSGASIISICQKNLPKATMHHLWRMVTRITLALWDQPGIGGEKWQHAKMLMMIDRAGCHFPPHAGNPQCRDWPIPESAVICSSLPPVMTLSDVVLSFLLKLVHSRTHGSTGDSPHNLRPLSKRPLSGFDTRKVRWH